MITASDFKKHISKTLSGHLKELGFKGSGFTYLMDTDNFIFTIGIQPSRYGGQCCAEFGIQPRSLDTNGFETLNFKKLKYYECEFRMRIAPAGQGDNWWEYSDNEQANIKTASEIVDLIKAKVIPIINHFKAEPDILEKIDTADLEDMHKLVPKKLSGINLAMTEVRLAWVLSKALEYKNLPKAKEFAKFGLSKIGSASNFFGKTDFENITAKNIGA